MCFWYWFPFLMLLFQTFNHCNFVSLQICFLTKLMMVAFVLSVTGNSWAALLTNWSAFSFPIMFLRLNIHCMRIWHWFWRKLVKFCRMSSNNFALTLLFAFSLCKVIWLFVYTQISLFLSAFSLHIAIVVNDVNILIYKEFIKRNCRVLNKIYDKCEQWSKLYDIKFLMTKHELIHFMKIFKWFNMKVDVKLMKHQIDLKSDIRVLKVQLNFKLKWVIYMHHVKAKLVIKQKIMQTIIESS